MDTGNSDAHEPTPLEAWREGEVWFREWIPSDRPWGSEELLDEVPAAAVGHYGLQVSERTTVDGQRYEAGEVVIVDSRSELLRLWSSIAATAVIVPWYGKMIPIVLVAPSVRRIDLATYRAEHGARFVRSLLITAGLVAVAFFMPQFQMLGLLIATMYGLFPLVESGMAWLRRVDRFSVDELNRRVVNFELFRRWFVAKRSRLLMVGLAGIVLVFVGQCIVGRDASIHAAALVKLRVFVDGEWWRTLTTGLMHGSEIHLLFNGMALYSLGRVITALVSPSLLGAVFLATVLTGSLASLWLGPAPASVGASGGILGCLGFLLMVTVKFRRELPGYLQSSLIQSTLVVAIFGLLGSGFIDNAAHAGGFVGGIVLGAAFYPWIRLAPTKANPFVKVLSGASLLVLLAGFGKVAWELWKVAPF